MSKVTRAVKVIPKRIVTDVEMLKAEIDIMIDLDHPNVIKLIEFFEDDHNVYLVMEMCRGGELFDRILDKGSYSLEEAAFAMRQMLQSIVYCHTQRIIHQDLKPENFLYRSPDSEDGLKLIDFGLSGRFQRGDPMAASTAGTVWYMAPEKLNGAKYDEKCDIWGLGVVLYIMLVGYPPFSNDQAVAVKQIKRGEWSMDGPEWQNVSYQAKSLLRKMMDPCPETRISGEAALKHPFIADLAPVGERIGIATTASGVAYAQTALAQPTKRTLDVLASFKRFRRESRLKRAALGVISQFLTEDQPQVRLLRDLFFSLDRDGDGILDVEDIRAAFKADAKAEGTVGLQIDDITLEKLLRGVDVNRSGKVDYSEFVAAMLSQDVYSQEHLCKMAFQAFDPADSGFITSESLRAVLGASLGEQSLQEYQQMISEIDRNNDGKIDFNEFQLLMKSQLTRHMSQPAVQVTQPSNPLQSGPYRTVAGSAPAPFSSPVHVFSPFTVSSRPQPLKGESDADFATGNEWDVGTD